MQIKDRTFLIAGGSSGLGAATCHHLSVRGARIVIADIDRAGKQLAQDLGTDALFTLMDVADETSVAAAVALTTDRFGTLHGAVVCAGVLGSEKVLGRDGAPSCSNFRRVIEINLIGTFNVVRAAANIMRDNEPGEGGERGIIITTSSIAADEGQIGQAAYSASKGGVAAMTLPIAREVARFGIRVVSIAPGIFETAMMASISLDLRRSLTEQIPFPPRFGNPGEFASLVEHVIENQMLNGTTIRLDGALRMQAK